MNTLKAKHYIKLSILAAVAVGFGMNCSDVKLQALAVPLASVNVQINNYCPVYDPVAANRKNFSFKDLFVYNSSAYFNGTNWILDTDRDGLPDSFETTIANINQFGISYLYSDFTGQGYSDLVRVTMGIAQGAYLPVCNSLNDTDGDGLNDCEEALLGTGKNQADTDGDGIPDYLEVRFGMNPLDPNDYYNSVTGDGYTNYQKVKMGIPTKIFLPQNDLAYMPVYQTMPQANTVNPVNSCYSFLIKNIPIVNVSNGNQIKIQAVEDNLYPATGGTFTLDREVRNHTIIVPANVQNGITIIVPDGINSAIIDGVDRPLQTTGGKS